MKLDINKDLLQKDIPSSSWLIKDNEVEVIRNKSKNVSLPLSKEDELVMHKLIDFVRFSQDPNLNKKDNFDYIRPAVGLAAPQIGVNLNMFFTRFEWGVEKNDVEEFAMINAKIIAKSEQMCYLTDGEGCLSVDVDHQGIVPRNYKIKVVGYDWLKQQDVDLTLRGYQAIVFQHELEHNNGKLYYDKINEKNPNYVCDNWIGI